MNNIILYVCTIIPLTLLDCIWLTSMGGNYKKWLAGLFASSFNFTPAVIFYLLYTVGIIFFVVSPALKNGSSYLSVLLAGLFFGFIAYAAYDLTNHATLKDWPLIVTVVDMAWGAVLTGLTSLIAFAVYKYFR